MSNNQRHLSSNKKKTKITRNELNNSPLKYRQRRKSSIPLQIREFISNNVFNQLNPEASTKNSYNICSDKKYHIKEIINNSIPEESENSSNNNEEKNKKKTKISTKKGTKNEIENNNYYIHYIKNVYEKEPHLNKENITKSEKKKTNDNHMKYMNGKKNFNKINRRRNSEMNKYMLKSNFHNLNMDKEPIRSDIKSSTFANKNKINDMIVHNNKSSEEKEKNRSNRKNKERHKSKELSIKEEDKYKDNNIHHMKNDSPKKNSSSINTKKKEKEALESVNKTENGNINENKNIKNSKKMNKLKKFFCCLLNDELSIEND